MYQYVYILIYMLILSHHILYLTWFFLHGFLGNLICVLHGVDFYYNVFTEFPFFSAIFLMVVMIAVFGNFPLFFVFCFIFPQGRESFWKCRAICFVQQISCHTCTVYLASFNSASKYCFLLFITFTFSSSQLDG